MEYLITGITCLVAFVGFIAVIRMISWAIFKGYFSAKEGKGFWSQW